MKLQTRFTWFLISALAIIALMVSFQVYQKTAERERAYAFATIAQINAAIDSVQSYVRHQLRPTVTPLSDEFVLEAMSTTFVARQVMDELGKHYPDYTFRFASNNPINADNRAGKKEQRIIEYFDANPSAQEWRGELTQSGITYLSYATPIYMQDSCLGCHPKSGPVPASITSRYPAYAGGGNDEIGIRLFAVPLALTNQEVAKATLATLTPVMLLMAVLVLVTLIFFRRFVAAPIAKLQTEIGEIEKGNFGAKVRLEGSSEFGQLGVRFEQMSKELARRGEQRQSQHEKLNRNYRSQKSLTAILAIALRADPVKARLEMILDEIFKQPWLGVMPVGSIFRFDQATQVLVMSAQRGMNEQMVRQCSRVDVGDCLCGQSAASKTLIYSPRHQVEDDIARFDSASGPVHGHYIVPILKGETLHGVLNLYLDEHHERSAAEETFLKNVANCVAGIFERDDIESALDSSRGRLRSVFDHVGDAIFIHDAQGRIQEANEQACDRLGYTRQELLAMSIQDIEVGSDADQLLEFWKDLGDQPVTVHGMHRCRDGRRFPVEVNLGRFGGETHELVVACARDISNRLKAEEKLRQLSRVVEQSPVSVLISDTQGQIEYVNPSFTQICGYTADEVIGKNTRLFKSGRTPNAVYQNLWRQISQGEEWQGELCNRKKDGTIYWERVFISAIKDGEKVTHFLALKEDISDRKEYEQELYRQANFDSLTNLPNRALAFDRLEQGIARAHRNRRRLALMFIDIDHFKNINDSLGHLAGDQLLQSVAKRVQGSLRESDTLARLGGDEFTIILADIDGPKDAEIVAEKVLESSTQPIEIEGNQLFVGLSIGITCYPDDGEGAGELMKNADSAMYLAKDNGRNNFCFFTPSMNDAAHARLVMETELRFAMERREFSLFYQPLVDPSGRVAGAEALLRWNNAKLGMVSPTEFIPLAEDIGLIYDIGAWVLRRACEEASEWINHRVLPDFIAVNISGRQLIESRFISLVEQILQETGLPAACLELEITESTLLDNQDRNRRILETLSAQGIRLSIDDFGTGYSSLSYLQRYPFDTLKIDSSFIRNLHTNAESASLVKAIISMAQSLDLRIVGEGVEEGEQLAFLRQLGCDLIQGYHYSPPLPCQSFRDYVAHTNSALLLTNKPLED